MNYVEKKITFYLAKAYNDSGLQQAKLVVTSVRRQSAAMLRNSKNKLFCG